MEIILLIVLIIIVLVVNSGQNTRLNELHNKLKRIEHLLYNVESKSTEAQKGQVQKDKPQDPVENYFANKIVTEKIPEQEKEPIKEDNKKEVFEKPQEPVISDKKAEPVLATDAANRIVPERPPLQPRKPTPVKEPELDWYTKFRKNNPDLEKFIGENILSKVAITILVLGIAFFVKYAIDKEWINEVARVGIGILAGGVVLGFAHYLRTKFKAFSSVLVAGGISIFYFTIGIGFHEYHVFSQTVAFILMLLITSFSVFISVAYDRIEIAVLSIIGGFGTPFMLSTGSGNYQVLFTYILILDLGMLVLAYMRKWNLVNILTYIFTMLLYVVWLESKVINRPDAPYMGALLFGAAFYIIFILMNIVNNVKARREFAAAEISILLSNTFIFYACGMQILSYFHPEWKGIFSIAMAIINMICAWLLYKKFKADTRLVYMLIGLTLTFVTISVPVQLEGNYITLVWSFESVLLMWLGIRTGIALYRFSSIILLVLMMFSLFLDWRNIYTGYDEKEITRMVMLNKGFITGLVSALCVLVTAFLLKREIKDNNEPEKKITWYNLSFSPRDYSSFLQIFFVCLIYFVGILELGYQLDERLTVSVAYYIIMMSYHLLFFCVLNMILSRLKNTTLDDTLFFVNGFSVIVFVIGFSLLPIFDFKENMIRTETNYIGFIFHYISLAAALYLAIRTYHSGKTDFWNTLSKPLLLTCLLASAIVYVCSIELVLHIAHLRLGNVTAEIYEEKIRLMVAFETVQRHVIKAGFPILWGMLAFGFLLFGMKKHVQTFRVAALLLIALTVFKLFAYDIRSTSEGGKIMAFIILGVVLLVISFMYQKIKALIIEGRTEDKNPTS